MADIIKLIKKQSKQRVAELHDLSGRLSEQLKHLINLIPENTRQKSVEDFLNGIRESVLGETPRRKAGRKAKRASAPKRARKTGKGPGRRGRKKKETSPSAEEQKQA